MGLFTKAYGALNATLDSMIEKARKSVSYVENEQKSISLDPGLPSSGQGFRDKYTSLGFETLRRMAMRDGVVASIIQTRINQVAAFSRPQRTKYDVGYKIFLKEEEKEPEKEELKIIDQLEQFILNTGYIDDSRSKEERDSFEVYLRKVVRDRLIYDQIATELVPDQKNDVHHFVAVAGGSIRFALSKKEKDAQNDPDKKENDDEEEIKYVQVHNGIKVAEFTEDELIFRLGNPVTDIDANGYSIGELELLVNIITAHLQIFNYNKLFFTHGQASKGILHIRGNIPRTQLDGFRRQWHSQAAGNQNSWRTPIIGGADEVKWIPLHTSNRDMEFSNFLSYIIRVIAAIYQIDPMEINHDVSRSSTSQGSTASFRNEERIKLSKDRGLVPLLRFIENYINDEIISRMDERFVFRFVGMNSETQEQELARQEKEVKLYKTINEIRKESDMEELKLSDIKEPGDMILDPTFLQIWQAFKNPQPQPGEEGGFGGDDEEFDFDALFGEGKEEGADKEKEPKEDTEKSLKKSGKHFIIKV